jgi:hypothetical protein
LRFEDELEAPHRSFAGRAEETPTPCRARCSNLIAVDATAAGQAETRWTHCALKVGHGGGVELGGLADAVTCRDRDRGADPRSRAREGSDPAGNPLVMTEKAPQQRSPREQDSDLVGEAKQFGRRCLGRGDDKQQVRNGSATRRTTGCLDHRRSVGVDTDHQGCRLGLGQRERRATITRTEIDDHPLVAGDQLGDLPDVDLDEAASNDRAHVPDLTLPRRTARATPH